MDADEREIFDYLQTWGEDWVSSREVCRRAGGKKRYAEDNGWAKPVLQRMKAMFLIEGDQLGRYRIKPSPDKDHEEKWVAPDLEKILQEGNGHDDAERADPAAAENYEPD